MIFCETFSGMKGWKDKFFFVDRRAIPNAMAWRHHDFDVYEPSITMSEYLRFPFTTNVVVQKCTVMPAKENIVQHTTPLLLENQDIPERYGWLRYGIAKRERGSLELKEEHLGCDRNVKALERERNELSVANKNQATRIQELEADCFFPLWSTVSFKVTITSKASPSRLIWIFKLDEGKGLSLGCIDKEILAYPFVAKIASGYRHSVADLLKFHPDPAPAGGSSAPTISTALAGPPSEHDPDPLNLPNPPPLYDKSNEFNKTHKKPKKKPDKSLRAKKTTRTMNPEPKVVIKHGMEDGFDGEESMKAGDDVTKDGLVSEVGLEEKEVRDEVRNKDDVVKGVVPEIPPPVELNPILNPNVNCWIAICGEILLGNLVGIVGENSSFKKLFHLVSCVRYLRLTKPEPARIPLWVKIYNVPLEAWNVEGISRIASRIGTPIIMDKVTTSMCKRGYGRASFARVLIEVDATEGIVDNVEIWYQKLNRTMKLRVEYAWQPPFNESNEEQKGNNGLQSVPSRKFTRPGVDPTGSQFQQQSANGLRYGRGAEENVVAEMENSGSFRNQAFDFVYTEAYSKESDRIEKLILKKQLAGGVAVIDEEKVLKQKTKIEWLKEGDQNSAQFHSFLKGRLSKNKIISIQDDVGIVFYNDDVAPIFVDHFESFFGTCEETFPIKDPDDMFIKKIDVVSAMCMARDVSNDEIKAALFDIDEIRHPDLIGLKQGDPVSPDIFTITMEVFTLMLKRQVCNKAKFKYHWGCKGLGILNLCFSDDLMLFCHGDMVSASVLKRALDEFCLSSGLRPNMAKSTVYFGNVPQNVKRDIMIAMPFREGSFPIRYLGIPLNVNRIVRDDCTVLLDKVKKRVEDWRNKSLSFAGRLQLIASVLSSLNVFWASMFILPQGVCDEIDKIFKEFLWKSERKRKIRYMLLGRMYVCRKVKDTRFKDVLDIPVPTLSENNDEKVIWINKKGKEKNFNVNEVWKDLKANPPKERNIRLFGDAGRSNEVIFKLLVEAVRLRVMGLKLKVTNEVIKASEDCERLAFQYPGAHERLVELKGPLFLCFFRPAVCSNLYDLFLGFLSQGEESPWVYDKDNVTEHPSETKVFHNEDGNPARANIKQALGSYERPHKGVKASANSDIVYFFTSAQDGDPLQDDVRLCLGDDLKKAQDHNQRQVKDESKDHYPKCTRYQMSTS
ncbi:RNA-directed DNA polymerase, eukaryota, reverse transcriptase zinc-binding domain protein [Tanacetum coccineum]|uniref:RNA-directed DNA polymerase, eukaryota, reverse transcriptase zinc-binding domain protein n=1 Tax=Tanacetum coccineum TaxID=301880 RepID=A0ABQ4WV15_9ASTR